MKYAVLLVIGVIVFFSVQVFAGTTELAIEKLRQTKIDVSYDEISLEDVLSDIKSKTGVSIIIDKKSAAEIDIDDIEITMTLSNISGYDLLNVIAKYAEMRVVYKYGMAWMVTPEHYYDGRNMIRLYDVRDLTMKIKDLPGIKVRLKGNDTGEAGLDWTGEDEEPNVDPIDIDILEEIIPEFVDEDSWEENPGASIQQLAGMLIIRQAPEVHYEIMKFLSQIRSNN